MNQECVVMKYQIAIDGPSGVGKSTIAKILAENLGFVNLNTGLLFRAVAYCYAHRPANQSLSDLIHVLETTTPIKYDQDQIWYHDKNITLELKTGTISQLSSELAQLSAVRNYVLKWERQIAQSVNLVIEGRDIGTVVFPNAFLKIFLTASNQIRAHRRYLELKQLNLLEDRTPSMIEAEFLQRDQVDQTRALAPLVKANDAYEINTDHLNIEQVVLQIEQLFLEKIKFNQ